MLVLAQLLDVAELALTPVVVPDPDAEVRWVATSELVDPTPFLEGGEVLLTTGLETKGWRSEWRPFVERLRRAGVVALGLGTGLTHRAPPASLVRACEEFGVALFEVPRPTSFVSISRAAATLLERAEQSLARRVVAAQHDLTVAALGPGAEDGLLEVLAGLVHGSVAVFDADGSVLLGPHGAAGLDADRVGREITGIRHLGVRGATAFSDASSSTSVQPIGVRGQPQGYLVVTVPGRQDEADRAAGTTALSLLSLVAERRREATARDRTLQARAWELLADGHVVAAAALLEAAGRTLPARVQVLAVGADAEDLLELAEARRSFSLAAPFERGRVLAFSDEVPRSLLAELERRGTWAGVGSVVAVEDFAHGVATAHRALGAAVESAPVVDWSELAGRGVLGLVGREEGREFARTLVGPLDDVQRRTLTAFLEHHGSRIATAEALGVHRNTVRNRVESIETAWGRSLDDPAARVDAWVALQLDASSDQPPIGVTANGSS